MLYILSIYIMQKADETYSYSGQKRARDRATNG